MSEKDQKMSKKNPLNEAIKVVVRCRPMSEKEILNNCSRVVDIHTDKGLVELRNPKEEGPESIKSFTFDAVYDWNSTTEELYEETVWPLVKSVLEGFNGTIVAYGQTGTGKTYTMEGSKSDINQKGIIPKSFDQIFNYINRTSDIQCLVRTSYLEIYQEEIRDLLRQDQTKRLELRESAASGVYIQDLSTCVCRNVEEIVHVMNVGNKNRSIGSTNMNEQSSRSHALFIITVELSYQIQNENIVRIGKLNLVDLAGSERQCKSGASRLDQTSLELDPRPVILNTVGYDQGLTNPILN